VNKASIGDDDVVLEIGPGLGAITVPAAKAARRVIAIDKDGRIIGLLRTELLAAGIDNVEIREADILRTNLASVSVKPDGRWWYWATCLTIFHPRSSFS
jgi:16S rRNA (adenine1518-N6/adenine1519-N6)-dimethyltransferase